MPQPISIILYGPNDEADKTYVKKVISWGLLKRAVRLAEELDQANADDAQIDPNDWNARFKAWLHRNDRKLSSHEQMMDQVAEFVVEVFDGQFTVKQLETGAEASEIMTVLRAVISRANTMLPTNPPPKRRPRH